MWKIDEKSEKMVKKIEKWWKMFLLCLHKRGKAPSQTGEIALFSREKENNVQSQTGILQTAQLGLQEKWK